MRETFQYIYSLTGSIVFRVFVFAMCVYVLFNLYQIIKRAFEHKAKPTPEEIKADQDEQW